MDQNLKNNRNTLFSFESCKYLFLADRRFDHGDFRRGAVWRARPGDAGSRLEQPSSQGSVNFKLIFSNY
jgi:hypothetical protein